MHKCIIQVVLIQCDNCSNFSVKTYMQHIQNMLEFAQTQPFQKWIRVTENTKLSQYMWIFKEENEENLMD